MSGEPGLDGQARVIAYDSGTIRWAELGIPTIEARIRRIAVHGVTNPIASFCTGHKPCPFGLPGSVRHERR
jgi:hypothetical protein